MQRDDIPAQVSKILNGRPVRWPPPGNVLRGAYNGWDRTIEVFDAAVEDRMSLLELIEPYEEKIEHVIGGPLVIIFFAGGINE